MPHDVAGLALLILQLTSCASLPGVPEMENVFVEDEIIDLEGTPGVPLPQRQPVMSGLGHFSRIPWEILPA